MCIYIYIYVLELIPSWSWAHEQDITTARRVRFYWRACCGILTTLKRSGLTVHQWQYHAITAFVVMGSHRDFWGPENGISYDSLPVQSIRLSSSPGSASVPEKATFVKRRPNSDSQPCYYVHPQSPQAIYLKPRGSDPSTLNPVGEKL